MVGGNGDQALLRGNAAKNARALNRSGNFRKRCRKV